jgi:glycosyltransferase involved in cell wall biosynthesis
MKIELVANDGSPLGVVPPHIYGRGVGGAELSMMSLMQTFGELGHEAIVYNDPESAVKHGAVEYRALSDWNPRGARHDVVIFFRSPNSRIDRTVAKLKVWWSCDQYTVGDFGAFSKLVDLIVAISPYHKAHLINHWGIEASKIWVVDLGVLVSDYLEEVAKVKNRLIFCSVPDRGLQALQAAWVLVKRSVPDATLTITSDYSLWDPIAGPRNSYHRLIWAGSEGVQFLGNINRKELTRLQQEAEIHAYPCTYEELFCISVAECQVAGAIPVTSSLGAVSTTNEFGIVVPGEPTTAPFIDAFSARIVSLLTEEREHLEWRIGNCRANARKRFDWNHIAGRWLKLFKENMTEAENPQ